MLNKKTRLRIKRHRTIRLKISGTELRPRLVLRRSLKNFSAQLVDDTIHKTMMSMSTQDKQIKGKIGYAGNTKGAVALGEEFAKKIIEKGIKVIVFDRAGYLYHGRVKAFAEALRKGGLVF